jgi:lysozyme family protein
VSEFDRVMEFILREEGGLSNNVNDPGGETKYGISKKAYPTLNIAAITPDDAKTIYRNNYWNPLGLDDQKYGPALVLMDCAVNQGVKRAMQFRDKVATSSNPFVVAFQAERALHYASLPTFQTFGRGWMRRLIRGSMEACK